MFLQSGEFKLYSHCNEESVPQIGRKRNVRRTYSSSQWWSGGDRMNQIEWIAVDWGTSRMRLWALNAQGEIVETAAADAGMAKVAQGQFETTLLQLIEPWIAGHQDPVPVIACGMVGARQGWQEVPYEAVPCTPSTQFSKVVTESDQVDVRICWGLKQHSPADVMRGEETQIAGLLHSRSDYDGVVCLPGTHCKWARLNLGQVAEFQSFMTGELYELLAKSSVLRFSILDDDWHSDSFDEAVLTALDGPVSITGRLFGLRAESLVSKTGGHGSAARLSGYLIGLELASARRFWESSEVSIIGASKLAKHYQRALRLAGSSAQLLDTETMTLAGLRAAYSAYKVESDV